MRRKKQEDSSEKLMEALKDKRLPILTLDEKWYGLFPDHMKTLKIKKDEKTLMELIKRQGELDNDIKAMKKEKNIYMKEIVNNMEISSRNEMEKSHKVDEAQKGINDINKKIDEYENELQEVLPDKIKKANLLLAVDSMTVCYERIKDNNKTIEENVNWIAKMREELKEKILIKQDREMQNSQMYSYMHDIMGADLMEIFDLGEPQVNIGLNDSEK